MKQWIQILVLFIFTINLVYGQDRLVILKERLDALANSEVPGLDNKVDLNVGSTSLQTFLTALGKSNGVNINVDPGIKQDVVFNFTNETVTNILLFVCKKYNLDIQFIGSILSVVPYNEPSKPYVAKNIEVTYDTLNDLLTYDLKSDSLGMVVRAITRQSGKNIVLAPGLRGKKISGYIQNMKFQAALEKLVYANNLELEIMADSTFSIMPEGKKQEEIPQTREDVRQSQIVKKQANFQYSIERDPNDIPYITLEAYNTDIGDMIIAIADELGVDYIFFNEMQGNTTASMDRVLFDEFLDITFKGTRYDYTFDSGVYILGERNQEGLRNTDIVQLQYRSLDEVLNAIPNEIKTNVQIFPFKELNSLILSGSKPNIIEISSFIRDIDQPVPVIQIELIIVDIQRTRDVSTGITAGVGDEEVETKGTILPGIDFTFGSGNLNDFLDEIGLSNLGGVTANFYVHLQLAESNGYIDITSTPRLATLNGHQASMSIGQTDYYLEQQQNVIGTQNPQTIVTEQWKSVQADFTININPTVSGDEHVTLDISVNQSDFTARASPSAPPGKTTRQFKSMIRVKNGDMIVLGGLERNAKTDSGTGLPFLARVPILKWFFSSRTKSKDKSKLLIFIKPTIIY